jgi:hypothetical protein
MEVFASVMLQSLGGKVGEAGSAAAAPTDPLLVWDGVICTQLEGSASGRMQ